MRSGFKSPCTSPRARLFFVCLFARLCCMLCMLYAVRCTLYTLTSADAAQRTQRPLARSCVAMAAMRAKKRCTFCVMWIWCAPHRYLIRGVDTNRPTLSSPSLLSCPPVDLISGKFREISEKQKQNQPFVRSLALIHPSTRDIQRTTTTCDRAPIRPPVRQRARRLARPVARPVVAAARPVSQVRDETLETVMMTFQASVTELVARFRVVEV